MPDTFLYFAYGSNMLTRRLRARTPSATVIETGCVVGYRLTFDKVSTDGSGKADMEHTGNPTDRIYGVLYEIANSEEGALNRAEGLGLKNGYRKDDNIQVRIAESTIRAKAYIATATAKDPAYRPYHWYKAIVIAGAVEHNLPAAYIEWLRTVDSQADPNATRRAENEALLFNS